MKILFFIIITIFVVSCQLDETSIESPVNTHIISSHDNSISDKSQLNISSFTNLPDKEINPKCYFSLGKNVFEDTQYIFAVGEEQKSYMHMNGEWIEFMTVNTEKNDSLFIMSNNNSPIQLEIKLRKDSITHDYIRYFGEMILSEEGKKEFVSSIYGECDC